MGKVNSILMLVGAVVFQNICPLSVVAETTQHSMTTNNFPSIFGNDTDKSCAGISYSEDTWVGEDYFQEGFMKDNFGNKEKAEICNSNKWVDESENETAIPNPNNRNIHYSNPSININPNINYSNPSINPNSFPSNIRYWKTNRS